MATEQVTNLQGLSTKLNELWQYKAPLQTPFNNLNTGLGQLDQGQQQLSTLVDQQKAQIGDLKLQAADISNQRDLLEAQFRNAQNQTRISGGLIDVSDQIQNTLNQLDLAEAVSSAQSDFAFAQLEEQERLNNSILNLANQRFDIIGEELKASRGLIEERSDLALEGAKQRADQQGFQNRFQSLVIAQQAQFQNARYFNQVSRAGLSLAQVQTAESSAQTGLTRAGLQTGEQIAQISAFNQVLGGGGNVFADKSGSFARQMSLNQASAQFQEALGRSQLAKEAIDLEIEGLNLSQKAKAAEAETRLKGIAKKQEFIDKNLALFEQGNELEKRSKLLDLDFKEEKLELQKTETQLKSAFAQKDLTAKKNLNRVSKSLDSALNLLKSNRVRINEQLRQSEYYQRQAVERARFLQRHQEQMREKELLYQYHRAKADKRLLTIEKEIDHLENQSDSVITKTGAAKQTVSNFRT